MKKPLKYIGPNEEEDDIMNNSQGPFYQAPAIDEVDKQVDDMGQSESARLQRARAEKNGFKQVQLLSNE